MQTNFKKPIEPKGYVTVRMPDRLRSEIQKVADQERRSLSSPINFMLERLLVSQENKKS